MTSERIRMAKEMLDIDEVMLATSQQTNEFYARHGFVITKVTPDGFGPRLDCYDMRLVL